MDGLDTGGLSWNQSFNADVSGASLGFFSNRSSYLHHPILGEWWYFWMGDSVPSRNPDPCQQLPLWDYLKVVKKVSVTRSSRKRQLCFDSFFQLHFSFLLTAIERGWFAALNEAWNKSCTVSRHCQILQIINHWYRKICNHSPHRMVDFQSGLSISRRLLCE